MIANYEEASLFACTKDFLLSNSCPPISRNSYTEQMDAQIGAIIDKEVNATVVPGFINWGKYKEFKKAIYLVKSSEYSSDQKDDFIVQSYSLMNLFMTAVFPIGLLEDLIECGVVDNVEKPELRLHRLEETVKNFPDYLKDSAASVISLLEDVYLELHDSTPKEAAFLKVLEAQQSKIAVVVPKAYFSIVIDKFLRLHNLNIETNICIMTANRFDNTQLYGAVIVVGNISGKRFDALRCRSSQEIDLLLYECEKYRYKKQARDAKAAEHLLNKRSTILIDDEYEEDSIGIDEDDLNEVDIIDTEITDYISSAPIKAIRNSFSGGDGKNMAEIVAVAKFDSDEIAFFTKNYKAYDENAISEWQKNNPEIQHRVDVLNENYRKSFIGQSKPRKITAKFLLLHTISHALIKQLSFECGYSIASLKERLYCSEAAEGKQMSGIFIYTASGDSEGTMGGLVRQGYADTFPGIFKKATEEAMTCSNDPVCSLSMGQGRDSLNLSACYSCCLIPETSCEEFNIFLDRGTIVGTYENREMGFYSRQLYGAVSWKDNSVSSATTDASLKSSVHVIITDQGTDLRDSAYAEIWKGLRTWAIDTKERVLLSELENSSDLFSQKEKPYRDCIFQIGGNEEQYKCDLFWKKSQVALFTSDNEDCYAAAKNSNIRCIYCADDTVTVRKILDMLKGR